MPKTEPLSLAEHRKIGAELHAIQHRLTQIGVDLANRLGKASRVGRRAFQLGHVLTQVRSELDDILSRDFPDDFDTRVYYPGAEPDPDARWIGPATNPGAGKVKLRLVERGEYDVDVDRSAYEDARDVDELADFLDVLASNIPTRWAVYEPDGTKLNPAYNAAVDQTDWPPHLRDDAPCQQCSGCRRKTWAVSEFGQTCGMRQPDGHACRGIFHEIQQEGT